MRQQQSLLLELRNPTSSANQYYSPKDTQPVSIIVLFLARHYDNYHIALMIIGLLLLPE
jgi:hypothetical protein